VNFSLVNNGGTIAPGHSPGTMHVAGDLTLNGGLLVIEVGGTAAGEYDRLEVAGVSTLGGSLDVVAVDLGGGTYVPQLGDQIPFMASQGGTAGEFDMVRLPAIGEGLKWAILPGDVTNFLTVVSVVPEPASFLILTLGLFGIAAHFRPSRRSG
ncbi:MAG: PEP-CTERM sorting domain-containing protein, partial [Pirellulales bacterium]